MATPPQPEDREIRLEHLSEDEGLLAFPTETADPGSASPDPDPSPLLDLPESPAPASVAGPAPAPSMLAYDATASRSAEPHTARSSPPQAAGHAGHRRLHRKRSWLTTAAQALDDANAVAAHVGYLVAESWRSRGVRPAGGLDPRVVARWAVIFATGLAIGAFLMYLLTRPAADMATPDLLAQPAVAETSPAAARDDSGSTAPVASTTPVVATEQPASVTPQTVVPPAARPVRRSARTAAASARRNATDDDAGSIEPVSFYGTLAIRSQPPGGRVFINGVPAGTTPLVLEDARIGSRALRIEMDGYEHWSGLVRVVAGERAVVSASMRPSAER